MRTGRPAILGRGLTEVQAGRFVARGRIFCGEGQAVLQSSRDGGVGADFSVQALLDSADQLPGHSCTLPDRNQVADYAASHHV